MEVRARSSVLYIIRIVACRYIIIVLCTEERDLHPIFYIDCLYIFLRCYISVGDIYNSRYNTYYIILLSYKNTILYNHIRDFRSSPPRSAEFRSK